MDPRKNTSRFYDIVAHSVDDVPFYLDRMKQLGASDVLELGCGTGRVLLHLAGTCARIVGVDYSREMLDRCDEKIQASGLTNAQTTLGDITNLQLAETL